MKHAFLYVLVTMVPLSAFAQDVKLPRPAVSEDLTIPRKEVRVLESTMSYLEQGTGEVVLFVHGNPTSSYLWRNVMPHVSDDHRAIAVDLIGMGRSGKPDIEYRYKDHYAYLDAFIETLGLDNISFVAHDWGAALAWDYARQNPRRVEGIAFMEGVLPPSFPIADAAAMGDVGAALLAMRDPEKGRQMVIEENSFVEQMLPGFVNRPLGDKAMAEYRAPYLDKESRWPTLQWPRELPIEGEPADTAAVLAGIATFMEKTRMPALFLYADPGVVGPATVAAWYAARIRNVETSYIGQGFHYVQEDQPVAIGRAIDDWLRRH